MPCASEDEAHFVCFPFAPLYGGGLKFVTAFSVAEELAAVTASEGSFGFFLHFKTLEVLNSFAVTSGDGGDSGDVEDGEDDENNVKHSGDSVQPSSLTSPRNFSAPPSKD